MQKRWQTMKVLDTDGKMMDTINELGTVGWELVTVVPEADGYHAEAYLKRPL